MVLVTLFFLIVVGIPVAILALNYGERLAKRDERMGIYDGPRPRYLSEPETGPYAYGVGDTVQPANGATDYGTVLYLRRNFGGIGDTKVTVRNNRTGEIKTAYRNAWKKAELTW